MQIDQNFRMRTRKLKNPRGNPEGPESLCARDPDLSAKRLSKPPAPPDKSQRRLFHLLCAGQQVLTVVASSLATAFGLALVAVLARVNPFVVLVRNAPLCYAGATLLLFSYLCGMWAYVRGPIGLVAPICESGIVLGSVLAVLVLREHISRLQWAGVGVATIGVILIQVG